MSVWTTPITFVTGAVTAASMNAEIRDHANFLKGALDLITNSTTADTGTATQLRVIRTASTDPALGAGISGDTVMRFSLDGAGKMTWGAGGATAGDVNLYRYGADILATNDQFTSQRSAATESALGASVTGDAAGRFTIRADGTLLWGDGTAAQDTALYRDGADILATNDTFRIRPASASDAKGFTLLVTGEANNRVELGQDGTGVPRLRFGPGGATAPDLILYRASAGILKTDQQLHAVDGITTRTVAGAVSDASFGVVPGIGTIAIDTTNLRIYIKTAAATWKSVLTA